MKKASVVFSAAAALMLSGCYGSYTLTKKLYDWNGTFDQPISTVIHWIGGTIGGFITLTVDFLVLNTIEYWTGSNPLAMDEGAVEKQLVEVDGQLMEMTATKGKIAVRSITGEKVEGELFFSEDDAVWYLNREGVRTPFAAK